MNQLADVQLADVQPAVNLPAGVQPAVNLPAGVQPADVQPADVQPAVNLPAVNRPNVNRPAVVQPTVCRCCPYQHICGQISDNKQLQETLHAFTVELNKAHDECAKEHTCAEDLQKRFDDLSVKYQEILTQNRELSAKNTSLTKETYELNDSLRDAETKCYNLRKKFEDLKKKLKDGEEGFVNDLVEITQIVRSFVKALEDIKEGGDPLESLTFGYNDKVVYVDTGAGRISADSKSERVSKQVVQLLVIQFYVKDRHDIDAVRAAGVIASRDRIKLFNANNCTVSDGITTSPYAAANPKAVGTILGDCFGWKLAREGVWKRD